MKFRWMSRYLFLSLLSAFFLGACGGGGGGSSSPPPPTTTTKAATGITLHEATLNGTVNPHAQATTALFEWGTDNALAAPTMTAAQPVGAGSTDNTVSAPLTGLVLGTTYYFRVSATNASGTQKGTIASFTTALPNSPPSVTTEAASAVTISSATINGTVLPNELATSAAFEWGTDSTLAGSSTTTSQDLGAGTTSVAITAPLTGLIPGVKYYFRVTATNSAGTTKGTIANFTAVAQAPTVVTGAPTSITNTGLTLNGSVNPNGLAVTNAHFEYGTDPNLVGASSTSAQTLAAGFTAQALTPVPLTGLNPGVTYYFRAVATNSAGTTNGTIVSQATEPQAPTVVTAAADNISITGATLHGTVNPNGLAVSDAHFEYGTDSNMATFSTTNVQPLAAGFTNQSIAALPSGSLTPGTTYYFRTVATNSVGTTKGLILSFDTLVNPLPVANAGPDNSVVMGHPVTLDGSGSSDDGNGGTITYQWTQLSGTTATLSDNTVATPTFTAPTVSYPNDNLVFQLTVTSSRGPTATDNVKITVGWGFSDDFSIDTTAEYAVALYPPSIGPGTFTYDGTGDQVEVVTSDNSSLTYSHSLPASNKGVFSLDFNPTVQHPSHGGIWIRLKQDSTNYYEVSNFDPAGFETAGVTRVADNVVVDTISFTTGYTQTSTYPVKITFGTTQIVMEGFGQTITLPLTASYTVSSFEVETGHQDANYDNILLQAGP